MGGYSFGGGSADSLVRVRLLPGRWPLPSSAEGFSHHSGLPSSVPSSGLEIGVGIAGVLVVIVEGLGWDEKPPPARIGRLVQHGTSDRHGRHLKAEMYAAVA
jgi:hypothetical protein